VRAIAAESDVVLVVGSSNSSNSLRLVEVARREGVAAPLIEDATAVRPEWLTGASTIGLTAGSSAPPHLVDEMVAMLDALGPTDVQERTVAEERLLFALPKQVARHRFPA
jgi:4-hydroxy-3-methylbut-2-enyl diphosphate reductase